MKYALGDNLEVVDLFPRSTTRWPNLGPRFANASIHIAGFSSQITLWRRDILSSWLPLTSYGDSLSARLIAYAILTCERSLDLAQGTAESLEANRLFSASTAARSMLEIVGHILWMRSEMDVALQGDTPDIPRLDRATRQGLFSAPKDLGGDPGIGGFPMPTGRLVQAGKQIFGDHFHDDYTLLSALVHPVGLAIWSGDMINLPTPSVTEEQAEVFVKVIADGLHSTGHHALALLDVANQSSVVLPRPKPVSG